MSQGSGWKWSDEQRSELWRRWKAGQSMAAIGLALGHRSSSIHDLLAVRGGIAPVPRRRSAVALSLAEREEISRGLAAGHSIRAIAGGLERSPSTVSREIVRNGGCGRYRASTADQAAWDRALRPKPYVLAQRPALCEAVATQLALQWSPQQISRWLERAHPHDQTLRVSHETIYRSLFIQARGALKKELVAHLRTQRTMRRSQHASNKGQRRGQIVDAISIRERPAEVEDRAVPGHWEGDLITGSHNSHIATLVERRSRFVLLVKVQGKDAVSVAQALTRQMRQLPVELRKSLTWDRGPEMAQHKAFTVATDIDVYFCDPQSPWQRGSNENTNGLLRQYFPHGMELSQFSQDDLDFVATRLNQRPRQTLNFQSPQEVLNQFVASTP